MTPIKKIVVQDVNISISQDRDREDYICLTDMVRDIEGEDHIRNWMRNRNTIEFLGTWEVINNPDFKGVEFDTFMHEAGANRFNMTPRKWVDSTNAIGIISKSGRYGGTYAHKDIAFEFGAWISPSFKLYLIKEYQRLKEAENNPLLGEWNVKRMLSKTNYTIHTEAIKDYVIPILSDKQRQFAYANEADLLNVALWGVTASQWREANEEREAANIRDVASINELIVLSNMESYNAELTKQGVERPQRLERLREMAQSQIKSLNNRNIEHKFRAISSDIAAKKY